jgi:hypothetical protein
MAAGSIGIVCGKFWTDHRSSTGLRTEAKMKHHEPYLTAEALGIESWERDELIALWPKLLAQTARLDMKQAASACGSVCCIGGHIALSHGISVIGARRYVQNHANLSALFFPDNTVNFRHPGWRATGAQAAQAILNFLTTGNADWDRVTAAEI